MNNNIKDIIDKKLKNIFLQRFNIDVDTILQDKLDDELLSQSIGMESCDLLYLYFDIENEFNISIPQTEVSKGKFNTYTNIHNIVYTELINSGN